MTDTKKDGSKSKEGSRANSPTKQRAGAESKQSNHSNNQARKDYHQGELERLKESLQKEKSQIKKPKRKRNMPYVFTSMEPYCDTFIAEEVIGKNPVQPNGYINRETAIGLCDPWVDHTMDQGSKRPVPKSPAPDSEASSKKKGEKKKTGGKKAKEGSTRLPKFPAVTVPAGDLTTKTLYYSDVPQLRKQIREKYSSNADTKINDEYTRTKQDYYRMDLNKIDEYHPINRDHMRQTYFAYLQNNPGSKKAIYECVRESMKEMEENGENHSQAGSRPGSRAGSRPGSSRSHQSRPQSSRSRQSVKGES